MNTEQLLPFKVGDEAESMSFERGYRGAWFRCKIKGMGDNQRKQPSYLLEFFDYPDDKPRWTQLYQKLPYKPKSPQNPRQLMVRPSFPAMYRECEAPHPSTLSDVIVVVPGTWKVGDLVDWWYEGCYWSGTISQVYQDGNYQIHLLEPPLGEGKSYKTKITCLRPSLDWSPGFGWTIPQPQERLTRHTSVRLVHPCDTDVQQSISSLVDNSRSLASSERGSSTSSNRSPSCFSSLDEQEIERDSEPNDSQDNASLETTHSSSLLTCHTVSAEAMKSSEDFEQRTRYPVSRVELLASAKTETEKQNTVISSCKRPRETSPIVQGDDGDSNGIKAGKLCERSQPNSRFCPKKTFTSQPENLSRKLQFDSVELSIIELEELANKLRWLQGAVKYGMKSKAMRPSWNFCRPD